MKLFKSLQKAFLQLGLRPSSLKFPLWGIEGAEKTSIKPCFQQGIISLNYLLASIFVLKTFLNTYYFYIFVRK